MWNLVHEWRTTHIPNCFLNYIPNISLTYWMFSADARAAGPAGSCSKVYHTHERENREIEEAEGESHVKPKQW